MLKHNVYVGRGGMCTAVSLCVGVLVNRKIAKQI